MLNLVQFPLLSRRGHCSVFFFFFSLPVRFKSFASVIRVSDFISGNDSFHFNLNFIRHPILLSHPNFTQAITGLIPRLHSVVGSLKNAT